MRHVPMVLALAVSLPAAAPAQRAVAIPDDVRANVRARVDAGAWPSVVIGVVDGAGTTYFSFGSTALSGGQPVGPRTMYEIGSITKVFTSLALADMVVHGQAGLDDPLQRYLPNDVKAPERSGKVITLRLLAAQRSGLPRMPSNFAPHDSTNPYADYDTELLLEFLSGYTLPRDPGAQYEYSNYGVGLLGTVLARHDQASYADLIERRVTRPLGMKSTMVRLNSDARDRLAHGHADGKAAHNWDLDALAGAGALRSDAEDMTRFLAAAMGLSSTPLDSAFRLTETPQFDAGSPTMRIGLGWHILQRPSMRIIWHNGGTGGYRSFAGFDPDRRVGVVVLSNSTVSVDDVGFHVLDSTMALAAPRIAVAVPRDSLEAYVGRYQLSPTFTLAVTRVGDALFLQATGQDRFGLFASGRNEFFLRAVDASISFERDSGDRVIALILHQGGANQRAARLP